MDTTLDACFINILVYLFSLYKYPTLLRSQAFPRLKMYSSHESSSFNYLETFFRCIETVLEKFGWILVLTKLIYVPWKSHITASLLLRAMWFRVTGHIFRVSQKLIPFLQWNLICKKYCPILRTCSNNMQLTNKKASLWKIRHITSVVFYHHLTSVSAECWYCLQQLGKTVNIAG